MLPERTSFTKCSKKKQDQNCQADNGDMQPVKQPMNMWSNRPAMPIQDMMSKKQVVLQEDDKNWQVNMRPVK